MRRRLMRGWRRLSGVGEAELVPQARLSGPMPWVIAIMVALTAIAVAAGLSLRNTARATAAELEGGVTVQIVEGASSRRAQHSQAVLERLKAMSDLASLREVPRAEVNQLIEPWLGADVGAGTSAEIPVPVLIDVRLNSPVTAERLAQLREELRLVAPSVRVDAQSSWLRPVFGAIESLQWLAIALVALLATALAAAVLLAARSALGANRETIEIVHLLGGTDGQIAGVFQRSIGADAIGGGLVGLMLAAMVIWVLGGRFAGLGAGLVDNAVLGWTDWLVLGLVPVLAAVLAMLTARLTVLHTLREML